MREILFKAKSGQTWRYGGVFKYNTQWLINTEDGYTFRVSPTTICQYTGLKDAKDRMIFEGDILHFGDKNYLVFWNGECFEWQMRTRKDGFSFPVYDGQDTGCPVECITLGWVAAEIPILGTMSTEIVGNIYDNPELIEK